jgi:hypothetical protein
LLYGIARIKDQKIEFLHLDEGLEPMLTPASARRPASDEVLAVEH